MFELGNDAYTVVQSVTMIFPNSDKRSHRDKMHWTCVYANYTQKISYTEAGA